MTDMLTRKYYRADGTITFDRTQAAYDPFMRPMNQCIKDGCTEKPRHYLVDIDGETMHTRYCDKCVKEWCVMVFAEDENGKPMLDVPKISLAYLYNMRLDTGFADD